MVSLFGKEPMYIRKISDEIDKNSSSVFAALETLQDLKYIEPVKDSRFPSNVTLFKLTEVGNEVTKEIKSMRREKEKHFSGPLFL